MDLNLSDAHQIDDVKDGNVAQTVRPFTPTRTTFLNQEGHLLLSTCQDIQLVV